MSSARAWPVAVGGGGALAVKQEKFVLVKAWGCAVRQMRCSYKALGRMPGMKGCPAMLSPSRQLHTVALLAVVSPSGLSHLQSSKNIKDKITEIIA